MPNRRADVPLGLHVDRTGIKFLGHEDYQAPNMASGADASGAMRIWPWMALISDIRAVELTLNSDGDSPVLQELFDEIPDSKVIGRVKAHGAYDTRRCHTAIIARQAAPIIPIQKNGRPWKDDRPGAIARNETQRATWHYGRPYWKRWTGYHVRSRINAKTRNPKVFGERLAAGHPDDQTAEIKIRIAIMKHFITICTVEIVRVA